MHESHTTSTYRTQGLTRACGAVIALAVGLATQGLLTQGVAAPLIPTTAPAASFLAPAVDAGFSALCAQAAVHLINHEGHVGRAAQELSTTASLKALAATSVSAGAASALTAAVLPAAPITAATGAGTARSTVIQAGIRAAASASASVGIMGTRPSDALATGLRAAAADTVGRMAARHIGDAHAAGSLSALGHKAAHAVAGATSASLMPGGTRHALAGAASAVVAESVAEAAYDASATHDASRASTIGKFTGALAGMTADLAVGGDGTAGLAVGASVATTTVEENFIPHIIAFSMITGATAVEAYDIYQEYNTHGPEAAVKKLALTLGISAATVAVGGPVLKAAVSSALQRTPALAALLGKFGAQLVALSDATTAKLATTSAGRALITVDATLAKSAQALGTRLAANPPFQAAKLRVMGRTNADVSTFKSLSGKINQTPTTWTSPTGTKQTYKVWQRNDIDWSHVRTDGVKAFRGKTNLEAARSGFSPQLSDGSFATLHHLNQNGLGNLVEASTRYHGVGKPGQNTLHSLYGRSKPHPTNPIDRPKFDQDTAAYWKERIIGMGK